MSHTSDFSGAEVAMLRLIGALPAEVRCAVACPPAGPLADALDEREIERFPIAGSGVSFRLSARATAAGVAGLGRSAVAVGRLARRWGADVVHANGVRAGLLTVPVARLGGPPVVVQVHDHLPPGPLGRVVREVLARGDSVIAVSHSTRDNFDAGLRRPVAETVYISIDAERFAEAGDGAAARAALGLPAAVPVLGEVAQITPWKGQLEAIETLARVRTQLPEARLLLVGDIAFSGPQVRYDNPGYLRRLHERVAELGLQNAVHFLGRRDDVPRILAALDLFLLPSWSEPFGTAALEAMAAGTVPIVGVDGGAAEYVEDGVSGRVLPPRDVPAWADAAVELLRDPDRRHAMGTSARRVAAGFTDDAYAAACGAAYARVLRDRRHPTPLTERIHDRWSVRSRPSRDR